MLENVLRKLLKHIGLIDVSDGDLIRLSRTLRLDRLPPYVVFGLASIYPIIELAIKKIKNSEMDFTELMKENEKPVTNVE